MGCASIHNGEITIDVGEMMRELGDEGLKEIAQIAVFDECLIHCMCEWLTKGEVDCQDGHIPWYIHQSSGDVLEDARLALMPLMSEVATRLIHDLVKERDIAMHREKQWRDKCWSLHDRWGANEGLKRAARRDDVDYLNLPSRITQEQVRAWLKRLEDETPLMEVTQCKS